MSPRDLVYVGHRLDMARKAVAKVRDLPRETYDADENLRLALIHLVQVIGEAARQVSRDFAVTHPEVPWENIIGMRHKVVHDYLGVDEDIVWQVVTGDLRSSSSHWSRSSRLRLELKALGCRCLADVRGHVGGIPVDEASSHSETAAAFTASGCDARRQGRR